MITDKELVALAKGQLLTLKMAERNEVLMQVSIGLLVALSGINPTIVAARLKVELDAIDTRYALEELDAMSTGDLKVQ